MVDRYRPRNTLRDNLVDLYREQTEAALADNLGMASLERGRGFIELHDGDTVIAQLGDLPGGGFGVGLVQDGQVVDAAGVLAGHGSQLAAHDSQLADHAGTLDGHADRLTATEGVANGARAELDHARGEFPQVGNRLNNYNSRLNSHDNRLDDQEGLISAAQSLAQGARNELDHARGDYPQVGNRLNGHNSRLNSLENKVATLEGNYANLKSRVDQIYNWLLNNSPFPDDIPP